MKKLFLSFLLCSLFLVASCANKTSIRHRNDYTKTLKQSRVIAVLPAKAEVNMVSFSGDTKRMYDYEYEIENIIFKTAKPILSKKGYKVSLINKSLIKDKNIFSSYEGLHEDLGHENKKLYAEPMMDVEQAYNIENKVGKHAFVVGKETKSDVLFFINYLNNVKTNGARVMGVMMDALLNTRETNEVDKSTMVISMIDSKSGNILWSNFFSVSSSLYDDLRRENDREIDNKRINELLSSVLKNLPNKSELLDKIDTAA